MPPCFALHYGGWVGGIGLVYFSLDLSVCMCDFRSGKFLKERPAAFKKGLISKFDSVTANIVSTN